MSGNVTILKSRQALRFVGEPGGFASGRNAVVHGSGILGRSTFESFTRYSESPVPSRPLPRRNGPWLYV